MDTRQFIVGAGQAGSRLDVLLTQVLRNLSRAEIKHLIDRGHVSVNARRVLIAGWELKSRDAVEVRMPPAGRPRADKPRGSRLEANKYAGHRPRGGRDRFLEVIFEDKDFLVVDKPPFVLTEPKSDSPHEHLLGMMKGYLKRKFRDSRGSYVKLLHRLDRETSGVIVAAKSKIGEQLEDQFRSHKIDRHYLAVVEGRVEKQEASIRFPLEKGEFGSGKKVRVVKEGDPSGMRAITNYRVEERYNDATLLAVQVVTGRTHQVRVHFAEIGHPVVGDKLYGAVRIPFSRHALHAGKLSFYHPRTNKKMSFEAPPPQDLQKLIDHLRGIDE